MHALFTNLTAAETWHLTFCCFKHTSLNLPDCPEKNLGSCLHFSEVEWPEAARMAEGLRNIYEYLRV